MTLARLTRMPRFMLDHHWTKAHLSDEIDGNLRPEDRSRLRHHVHECEKCNRLLDSLRQTVDALRTTANRSTPGVAERVIERLDHEPAQVEASEGDQDPSPAPGSRGLP